MTSPRSRSGRWRIAKGNEGEREVLVLLRRAGWFVMNGAMAEPGVDLIALWPVPEDPNRFEALYSEAKNERWAARGRRYLGPISQQYEPLGIHYRVFTHESDGWWVRKVAYRNEQCRTVFKMPATVANLGLYPLLTGLETPPATPREKAAKAFADIAVQAWNAPGGPGAHSQPD